jgi:N-acetylmuramic acid 6-phosphate (MurNAc-6-P) etherase
VHPAPASCEAQVETAADELQRGGVAAELGAATVGRVCVLDDQATATAEFAQRRQTLVLRSVAGRWLVDGARG